MKPDLPKLPLGISDFAVLRENLGKYLYVDKTGQLFRMLDAGKYLFLARPRRFGKSLLCSTLKYLYEGRRELFGGLAIDPLWDWSKTNPVVDLSLVEVSTSDAVRLESGLVATMCDHAARHGVTIEGTDPSRALVTLLRALHEKTGRRVVVIIDEYEKPVHDHLGDLDMAQKMRDVLRGFYGALKGCDAHLEMLFITGIGRMVRTSIFSELNQMLDLTLLPEAAEVCGYTEDELRRDFEAFVPGLAKENAITESVAWEKLRERYNGYWWGSNARVYNPWSILNCLQAAKFDNFWWASGTPGGLVELAGRLGRPEGDLENVEISSMALLFDITQPRAIPLLWQSGYLTVKKVEDSLYTVGFPNAEVREAWHGMMLGYFAGQDWGAGQTAAAVMLRALETGDHARFERALVALFASIPGDLHMDREAFYHAVFVAALQAVGGEIIPESRTDKGRTDAVIKTRETIYVVEFKLGTAGQALAQIQSRRYFEPYLADPRPVVLLGAGGFAEHQIVCLWEVVRQ